MDVELFLAFFLLLLFHLLPLSAREDSQSAPPCPEFGCGNSSLMNSKFRYTGGSHPDCGLCTVNCTAKHPSRNSLFPPTLWFDVISINDSMVKLGDRRFRSLLDDQTCDSFGYDMGLSESGTYLISQTITLFKCKIEDSKPSQMSTDHGYRNYDTCNHHGFTIYCQDPLNQTPSAAPDGLDCTSLNFPAVFKDDYSENNELFKLLTAEFEIDWHGFYDRYDCHREGYMCDPSEKPGCAAKKGHKNLPIILGTVIPGAVSIFLLVVVLLICRRKKGINVTSYFLSRNTSEPSSKPDLESGSVFFGVPVFTYAELEEATNNFEASKELGDGGFGTVYFGKLLDGREVAVKRLYEHNIKRMQQFVNEIEILTRLRHRNLVCLYGCTSRHSRELLLVYEYIPNGTVADHLHGDKAQDKYLTWTRRMNIAIETADALAYLHKSDIIHRDVKTNNILLDHNFCVKVADFGLSRLFPNDVSHISTAPQGTPGYVDPEYHKCYQLTDKSDVYSFGVVLIELISSMPAVDISRHRHEINLANLAINRIQRCAFDELIDPSLGYKTNTEIMRMTTSVAELAFRCVQLEKEMRPSMEEVLETLKEIQNSKGILVDKTNEPNEEAVESRIKMVPSSPESEDIFLLKDVKFSSSPNSVADAWVSSSTTTSSSR